MLGALQGPRRSGNARALSCLAMGAAAPPGRASPHAHRPPTAPNHILGDRPPGAMLFARWTPRRNACPSSSTSTCPAISPPRTSAPTASAPPPNAAPRPPHFRTFVTKPPRNTVLRRRPQSRRAPDRARSHPPLRRRLGWTDDLSEQTTSGGEDRPDLILLWTHRPRLVPRGPRPAPTSDPSPSPSSSASAAPSTPAAQARAPRPPHPTARSCASSPPPKPSPTVSFAGTSSPPAPSGSSMTSRRVRAPRRTASPTSKHPRRRRPAHARDPQSRSHLPLPTARRAPCGRLRAAAGRALATDLSAARSVRTTMEHDPAPLG